MPVNFYSYQQRALDAIKQNSKGCCFIPTGGGKTVVMMEDAKQRVINATEPMTFVVVAPKILLANQLCSEFEEYMKGLNIAYAHVHSGETHHPSSTRPADIAEYNDTAIGSGKHHFIFTTYNSIGRVNEAEINLDVVYFDEAHHCVKKSNFVGIAHTSQIAESAYFFTATPKYSNGVESMNNTNVYGNKIVSIPAKELVGEGCIIPPQVIPYESQTVRTKENAHFVDCENIIGILQEIDDDITPKVLVASPSTKVIWNMFTESDLLDQLQDMGYATFHITAKHGAYVNNRKVSREKFFDLLNEYGNDPDQKMIVFHYSILSEGINVHGLTHCIMLRNLPAIEMCQTIGRVVRMHRDDRKAIQDGKIPAGCYQMYKKSYGKIVIPVNNNYGDKIAKQLQNVVDAVFERGDFVA
jgi:predicted helicase